MKSSIFYLLILFCVMGPPSPLAATPDSPSATQPWTPPPPPTDDFDWIQLVSGEWLKGELIAMYDGTIEFDSEELDLQEFDWDDIKQIRSGRLFAVRTAGNKSVSGRIIMADGKLVVNAGSTQSEFSQNQTFAIAQYHKELRSSWSGKISLGLNASSGNTNQTDFNLRVNADRRTAENRITTRYLGNYSEVNNVENINNHRLTGQYDIFASDKYFWRPLYGEYYRDPFLNVGDQITLGAGAGYHLIKRSKIEWDIFGGPAYQYTHFDSVEAGKAESETSPTLVFSTNYDAEIHKKLDLIALYQLQINNKSSGGYSHHAISTLELDLTDDIDFEISIVWDHIQHPTALSDGSVPEQDDFKMIFGLGVDF